MDQTVNKTRCHMPRQVSIKFVMPVLKASFKGAEVAVPGEPNRPTISTMSSRKSLKTLHSSALLPNTDLNSSTQHS